MYLVHLHKKHFMKIVFITLISFVSTSSFSQSIQDTIVAKSVINYDKLTLYCGVGIEVQIFTKADKIFEHTFKVQYIINGCMPSLSNEKMSTNNKLVSNYLDKKYGIMWRKQLRTDVLAITK